ncbi:tripartite tricarboxylate transporter substrate binding protein [Vreelandella titanicae]|uniref:tripartite tricarboxylate transporter substrate binding protein n=1 Tax=Vreelandella titanicae TaxID=664683 RepID=UPI00241FF0F9|nr:tripartite tricarboxylate transporter substrate binding protein [Halomonas titanicae]UEQ04841.1 tripartite tricarboxylate transporter substrate binding protein [Halomonas profundus]
MIFKTPTLKRITLSALILPLSLSALQAHADYPERPIQMIVPWAAGGGTDSIARTIAVALEQELGQPVNVVNRAGGGSVVGHTVLANAAPDGYTIGMMTGEISMMHWQGLTALDYEDFTPIAQVNYDYAGVQVSADSPYDNLGELIDAIRSQPEGTFKASGVGQGGIWHVAFGGMLVDQDIDPRSVRWIPSEGAAPAMVDLVAGGIDIAPTSVPEARAMIDAGRVKALAIMAPERNPVFPDVPTLKEEIDSNYTLGEWRGIGGPAGMDEEVVATLEAALQKAFVSDIYQDFMRQQGFGAVWRNSADFTDFMQETDALMGNVVDNLGLKR